MPADAACAAYVAPIIDAQSVAAESRHELIHRSGVEVELDQLVRTGGHELPDLSQVSIPFLAPCICKYVRRRDAALAHDASREFAVAMIET